MEHGQDPQRTWVIVLAGGEGRRLTAAAEARYGYARPKQFCDFGTGTLLAQTIARARRLAPDERIVVVTTRTHHADAAACLRPFPHVRHVEQPDSRGTTPGILLPLFEVLGRDPRARIVIMPSDHCVADAPAFTARLREAVASLDVLPYDLLLIGVQPVDLDEGYGWIVPESRASGPWPAVATFREKPPLEDARALAAHGALINTFVMVGVGWTFASLFLQHTPTWFRGFCHLTGRPDRIDALYAALPESNFSDDVLAKALDRLRVAPLPEVGWSDIGTPERLARTLEPAWRSAWSRGWADQTVH